MLFRAVQLDGDVVTVNHEPSALSVNSSLQELTPRNILTRWDIGCTDPFKIRPLTELRFIGHTYTPHFGLTAHRHFKNVFTIFPHEKRNKKYRL